MNYEATAVRVMAGVAGLMITCGVAFGQAGDAAQPATQPAGGQSAPEGAPAQPDGAAPAKVKIQVLEDRVAVPSPGDGPVMRKLQAVNGIVYRLPQRWIAEAPSNQMRLAQIRVPALQGSGADDALLTVTGNIGGTIDENLARWAGQFVSVEEGPYVQKVRVGRLTMHTLFAIGTFNAAMPGAPAGEPVADTSMRAAIVEGGPAGPVFFKLVGPRSTVEGRKTGWEMFLRNMDIDPRGDSGVPGESEPKYEPPVKNPSPNVPTTAPSEPAAPSKPETPSKP